MHHLCAVIVPTSGFGNHLGETLSALSTQSVPRSQYEIIVVDNSRSIDGSIGVRHAALRYDCAYVRETTPGAGAARNAGVAASSAPILIFVDDDVIVTPEFLGAHLAAHDGDGCTAVVGPIDQQVWGRSPFDRYIVEKMRINQEPNTTSGARTFYGANCSVQRTSFLEVGGFDPAFLRRQDGELGFRLWSSGCRFVVAVDARASHRPNFRLVSWLRRCRRDGYYLAMLSSKHPGFAELENLHIYTSWRPIAAGVLTLPLVAGGLLLYVLSPRPFFLGLTSASLVQSSRGFREFRRESQR